MNVVVLRETQPGEARAALMPESVKKLTALNCAVLVETDAGLAAARTDNDYRDAGAEVSADRDALLSNADVLAVVNRPPAEDFSRLKKGAVVIGFLRPLDEPRALTPAVEHGITTFSVELIPRITRAQAMDALSSMATVAGYKAVLIGATHIPRMFPLLMTAAGTVPPARVLVLGAGADGGHELDLDLVHPLHDLVHGGVGGVDLGGAEAQRVLDHRERLVVGPHRGGDRPVGGVVLGFRNTIAGGDPVLRGLQRLVGRAETLKRRHRRSVRHDA